MLNAMLSALIQRHNEDKVEKSRKKVSVEMRRFN